MQREETERPSGLAAERPGTGTKLAVLLFLLEPSLALAAIALGARAFAEPSPAALTMLAFVVLAALAPLPFLVRRAPAVA
jgi:hypothetical protein